MVICTVTTRRQLSAKGSIQGSAVTVILGEDTQHLSPLSDRSSITFSTKEQLRQFIGELNKAATLAWGLEKDA